MSKKRLRILILVAVALVLVGEVLWSRLSYRAEIDPSLQLQAEWDCTPYSVVAEPFIDIYEFVFDRWNDLSDATRKFCGQNPIKVALDDLKKGRAQSFYSTRDIVNVSFAHGGLGRMGQSVGNVKVMINGKEEMADGCVIGGQFIGVTGSNNTLRQRLAYYNYTIALSPWLRGRSDKDCRPSQPDYAAAYDLVKQKIIATYPDGEVGYEAEIEAVRKSLKQSAP